MSKKGLANESLIQDYFDGLLHESAEPNQALEQNKKAADEAPLQSQLVESRQVELNKLLQQASLAEKNIQDEQDVKEKWAVETAPSEQLKTKPVEPEKTQPAESFASKSVEALKTPKSKRPETAFQALFFEVAGLTLAVPLIELGGIHNLQPTSSLFGKPDWFKGVMLNKAEKLNVVDTALWVMPEKFNTETAAELEYKYLIMLGDSQWGLACETLVATVTLQPDDVKWSGEQSKRRWLGGLVRDKMCALLSVDELILLLDKGFNSRSEKNNSGV
ncbi:chemotaxis protein CheW [Gayadomonas joobiniege]|uniref:chemotaxis protein CheW n=1 Tax=Gayadomonas joobiniege TaxID=1234606 RepID=UPI00036EA323|nr:chemotaxis protein CheW [Gayadomonas joobiniege]